jgi:hypothetical protein
MHDVQELLDVRKHALVALPAAMVDATEVVQSYATAGHQQEVAGPYRL